MFADLGLLSLIVVAIASSASSAFGFCWLSRKSLPFEKLILPLTILSCVFSVISISALAAAFYYDDFSLAYVAGHSNSQLPVFFKIAAVWGGHEGSQLFWVVTLSCWAGVLCLKRNSIPSGYLLRVLWVMQLLTALFAWFTLLQSNPFSLSEQVLTEGRDLNPMLQDAGLIFHPPLLYFGYVGFAATLAFAFAALMMKQVEVNWVSYCRRSCLVAWGFLSAGIALGSWWAYYELGWGGWWFWDPVENASLLPWLTATGLLHGLMVARQSQQLLKWVYSLAFVTFSLSILGTFVVRSGILTSVHAFALSPGKGILLLMILALVLASSFGLLLFRDQDIQSKPISSVQSYGFFALLTMNLFVVSMLIVLLGTFYPLIYQMLGWGNISVGAPYFNLLFAPLSLFTLAVMALMPLILHTNQYSVLKRTVITVLVVLVSMVSGYLSYRLQIAEGARSNAQLMPESFSWMVQVTWFIAIWMVLSHLFGLYQSQKQGLRLRTFAMFSAHLGIAIICIGAAMNSYHSSELGRKMGPGTDLEFGRYHLSYQQTELYVGPNFTAERSHILVTDRETDKSFMLFPDRRHYQVRVMNMSEPAIQWFWHGDVYITLGEKLDADAYALRIQYRSYVRWIWFGALLLVTGAVISLFSRASLAKKVAKTSTSNLSKTRAVATNA